MCGPGAVVSVKAEVIPGVLHSLLTDVVEEEDEEALQRVEDTEEVLEHHTCITDCQEPKHPRQTCSTGAEHLG